MTDSKYCINNIFKTCICPGQCDFMVRVCPIHQRLAGLIPDTYPGCGFHRQSRCMCENKKNTSIQNCIWMIRETL